LKAYTEAVNRRAAGAEVEAVALLERAIAIDPQFALAHTTLSSIYGGFGETGESENYARLAYEHRERVSERERLFITYQYHDRVTGDQVKAREALEVWKRTYPRDYRPSNALALLLIRLGEYDAAAVEAEEVVATAAGDDDEAQAAHCAPVVEPGVGDPGVGEPGVVAACGVLEEQG